MVAEAYHPDRPVRPPSAGTDLSRGPAARRLGFGRGRRAVLGNSEDLILIALHLGAQLIACTAVDRPLQLSSQPVGSRSTMTTSRYLRFGLP